MIQADHPVLTARPAAPSLPHRPADSDAVRRYILAVQTRDQALAAAQAADAPADRATVLRRRADLDAAVVQVVDRAARRMSAHRQESLATLNAVFLCGHAPTPALNGECRGRLITSTVFGLLDSYSRGFPHVWMPWLGKRFHAAQAGGDNMFRGESRFVGRLFWPTFSAYHPFRAGKVTAFPFRTSVGPGLKDSGIQTLKLDYDLPDNPGLLIRSVLDELVQVSGNYYLGKVYRRKRNNDYHLIGYFDLRRADAG